MSSIFAPFAQNTQQKPYRVVGFLIAVYYIKPASILRITDASPLSTQPS